MKNYLENNLNALKKVNTILADIIEKSVNNYPFLDIKHNDPFSNLFIKMNNKINSAYGIENQINGIEEQAERIKMTNDSGTVLIGIGLGHFAHALCIRKEEKHIIVIVETIPYLIKEAFALYDFSKYIKNGTFLIACPDQIEFQMIIGMIESNCVIKEWNIIAEPYTTLLPELYSELTIYVGDLINQIRCNTGTVMGNGKIIAQNDIKNLPYILSSWGIDELKDMFKNRPAVIVSTGPSLRKNIHCLKQYKDRVIIICVAQALRILLSYDIVPDFACTVDFGEVNYEHFKGLMNCGVPLIALNRCYYKILQEWEGQKIIVTSPNNPLIKNTASFLGEYGYVEQGGSVSHMAVGSAIKMGCNPIILIGQDLAYENNLSHNPNADASGKVNISDDGLIKWNVDDPNSILKNQECIMGTVQEVSGYLESNVNTNIGLLSFITSFEHIFKRYEKITFINSTEGGADIKGAKNIVLRDALRKYTQYTLFKTELRKLMNKEPDIMTRCKKVKELLTNDIKELEDIIIHSNNALMHSNQAVRFFNAKRKLKRYLDLNSEESNKAHELAKKNDLLSIAIYYASRQIYAKELFVDGAYDHISKDKKDFLIRVDRNKLILNATIKESTELLKLYKLAIEIITTIEEYYTVGGDDKYVLKNIVIDDYHVIKVKEELNQKIEIPYNLEQVEEYFRKRNFSYPLLEANKALDYFKKYNIDDKKEIDRVKNILHRAIMMRKETIDEAEKLFTKSKIRERIAVKELIEKSIKCSKEAIKLSNEKLKQDEFEKAMSLIKEAHKLMPENELVLWGLATINFFLKNIDDSIKWYNVLIGKYPANYRYQYEYGNVLLNVEPEKGIKEILSVMAKTNQFDHFFKHIGKFYYLKSDFEKATLYYKQYHDKFPADYEVIKILIDCYEQLKNYNLFKIMADKYKVLTGEVVDDSWSRNALGEIGKDLLEKEE
ncbi:MAG: 6-hydroxymethylpterin diphosphokinase MptE-like protein [Methanogenium sp.]|jgi:hypothetical protein